MQVRKQFPSAVCLALTATATAHVRQDIRSTLQFATRNEFVASFNRENLYIEVVRKRDPITETIEMLERYKDQSGIVYCFSRKQVDELAAYLVSRGYSARSYHAGLEDAERKRNQEAFIRDDAQVIVATIAFGMGINKPNVRFVIQFDLPKSIEGYYQEIGRSGRDGLPAHCILLYSYSDVAKINYLIDQKEGEERRVAVQHLNAIVSYAEDETTCRRKPLLAYFGESYSADNCSNCDNCTSAPAALTDVTIPAQKFLSCVKRAGEKFGAGHITDILLGSKNEKVLRWGHDKLSTYGIGAEWSHKQWMHLARQLLSMGYLKQEGEYRTLSLTVKALEALKKREPIFGVLQEAERVRKKEEVEYNHALFAILRQKRKEMADEAGVPPYVIFSDKTLVEMAAFYPQSYDSLLQIFGVGQAKLGQYGETFLEIIKAYCEKHGLKELPHPQPLPQRGRGTSSLSPIGRGARGEGGELPERTRLVAQAFNAGDTIPTLMKSHQVTMGTILDHLMKYTQAGNSLRKDGDVESLSSTTPEQRQTALAAFAELGAYYLKPIYDKLNGALNYDDLKILRVAYLISQQEK